MSLKIKRNPTEKLHLFWGEVYMGKITALSKCSLDLDFHPALVIKREECLTYNERLHTTTQESYKKSGPNQIDNDVTANS